MGLNMTRINCVPVQCLSDKHLQAEYFELPRIFTALEKKTESELNRLPSHPCYTMGTGHVTFFYNKLDFIVKRYMLLANELINRGVNISLTSLDNMTERYQAFPSNLCKDWTPTPADMYVNMARLVCNHSRTSPQLKAQLFKDLINNEGDTE
jgi:deoxyribonuclease (pyrimidine dimer)